MKRIILTIAVIMIACTLFAQTYPEPEFTNEVYFLKKDSVCSVMRLEKNISKMEAKTKLGGLGGYENGYEIDGTKSSVRIRTGTTLSFILSKGKGTVATSPSSPESDSLMRANGIDPGVMPGIMDQMNGMNDPSSSITLYKTESEKGKRKILMQKSGSAMPFSSKKIKSSDKYSFSVKKIRDGYWELVIDKILPKGEYAFSKMDMTGMSMGQEYLLFAFGID